MPEDEVEVSTDEELVADQGITDSDLEHENAQRAAPRRKSSHHRRSSKKTRHNRPTSDSESESESAVSESLHLGKENRRINSIMPTGARSSSKAAAGKTALSKELAKEKAIYAEKDAELQRLKAALLKEQAVNVQPIKPKPRNKMSTEEKRWKTDLQSSVKSWVWGTKKFINSDDVLIQAAGYVFDKWNLKEFERLTGEEREKAKAAWVNKNLELVRVCMNDIRDYAQSQLRAFIVERIVVGQWVPTPEEVEKCALCDQEFLADENNHKIFDVH